MKTILIAISLMLLMHANAQKIKQSEYDKFEKSYRIETSFVYAKAAMDNKIQCKLRSVDSSIFIIISGYGKGARVIGKDDEMIFLFSDDSTCKAYSTGIQDYEPGQYADMYTHQYAISYDAVVALSKKVIRSIRLYNVDHYNDTDIKENAAQNISDLAKVFLNEYVEKIFSKK